MIDSAPTFPEERMRIARLAGAAAVVFLAAFIIFIIREVVLWTKK